MADKAEKKSSADKGDTKSVASKFKGYVARPEVKELYATLKVSAKAIDGLSKTMEILSKPWVKKTTAVHCCESSKTDKFQQSTWASRSCSGCWRRSIVSHRSC